MIDTDPAHPADPAGPAHVADPAGAVGNGRTAGSGGTGATPGLRTSIWLVVGAALAGAAQGGLWAAVAPGVMYKVFADGTYLTLPTASANAYVSIAIYTLLGMVAGIALGTAAWRIRSGRGPAMFLLVTAAGAMGALVAMLVGLWLRSGVDPASVGPGAEVIVTAPSAVLWLALVIEPGLAAATYTILAAWNGLPHLGRDLPQPPAAPPPPEVPTAPQPAPHSASRPAPYSAP